MKTETNKLLQISKLKFFVPYLVLALFLIFASSISASTPTPTPPSGGDLVKQSLYSISNNLKDTILNLTGSLTGIAGVVVISLLVFGGGFVFFKGLVGDVLGTTEPYVENPVKSFNPYKRGVTMAIMAGDKPSLKTLGKAGLLATNDSLVTKITGRPDTRPPHQAIFEKAMNSKDWGTVIDTYLSMPDTDPYKSASKFMYDTAMKQMDDKAHNEFADWAERKV